MFVCFFLFLVYYAKAFNNAQRCHEREVNRQQELWLICVFFKSLASSLLDRVVVSSTLSPLFLFIVSLSPLSFFSPRTKKGTLHLMDITFLML